MDNSKISYATQKIEIDNAKSGFIIVIVIIIVVIVLTIYFYGRNSG